jgi:hypothetical protein
MSRENPQWGVSRIHRELLLSEIDIAESTSAGIWSTAGHQLRLTDGHAWRPPRRVPTSGRRYVLVFINAKVYPGYLELNQVTSINTTTVSIGLRIR